MLLDRVPVPQPVLEIAGADLKVGPYDCKLEAPDDRKFEAAGADRQQIEAVGPTVNKLKAVGADLQVGPTL
jgi:hypothetical protein